MNTFINRFSVNILCRIYLLAALLAATAATPLPYSPLALILLVAILYITFHPRSPWVNIIIVLTTIFLLPLSLAMSWQYITPLPPLTVSVLTVGTILPVLYLLDYTLRQNAPDLAATPGKEGVSITVVPEAIFAATTIIMLVSLFIDNQVLFFTSLLVMFSLLASLLRAIRVAQVPLSIPLTDKRLIAHTTGDIAISVGKTTSEKLYCRLVPVDDWVQISRQQFTLDKDQVELSLILTPPLSGPVRPQLQASVIDSRGLIQVNHRVEAVELHVIPRARYARWLATKYLEQAGAGITASSSLPRTELQLPRRGTEYLDSRDYHPGDSLRNIDWRHTMKLRRLITKAYTDAGGQSAIIVANLAVADADAADNLTFNLITAALTLARHGIPTALAAYDSERVISTSALADPKVTLTQALLISRQIATNAGVPYQSLQPPDIRRLRRNITQLKQATSSPARQLLGVLNFEYQAIVQAAKNHPATLALTQVTTRVSPPAVIVLISPPNHDAEALAITLEKLARRGFAAINIADVKT